MKLSKLYQLAIASLLHFAMYGQGNFQKSFYRTSNDNAFAVHQTSDGGYIIAVNSFASSDNYSLSLIKTNSQGDTLWTESYSSAEQIIGHDMKITSDGGFIIVGAIYSTTAFDDAIIIKTDGVGNILWAKVFGSPGAECLESVVQDINGDFVATGYAEIANGQGGIVVKLSSSGSVIWQKQLVGNYSLGNSIDTASSGGYIITGGVTGTGPENLLLTRLNISGNVLWSKAFTGSSGSHGHCVKATSDGGFIVTGETYVFIGPNSVINHVYLLKTDNNGNLLWSRIFGDCCNDGGFSVFETTDHKYVLTGSSNSFVGNNLWTSNAFLIKVDGNGNLNWCKYYGGNLNSNDYGSSVEETTDNGYIIGGVTYVNGNAAYLLKIDSSGEAGCNGYTYALNNTSYSTVSSIPVIVDSLRAFAISSIILSKSRIAYDSGNPCTVGIVNQDYPKEFIVFPNPTSGVFTVSGLTIGSNIEIFDALGQLVFKTTANLESENIDLSNFQNGPYFYRVFDSKNGTITGCVLKN